MKDFINVRDWSRQEILETLRVAADMKAAPHRYAEALPGKALALIFEKPSLRTRATFEVGIHQLGGFSLCFQPTEIQLGKRESVRDVAKNLERMVQGIMLRTFSHEVVVEMARHAEVPVINGLTDFGHPCQALADYFTVREIKGRLEGLSLAYVGDGNNVAHSLLEGGARLGVSVTVACPGGYEPDRAVVEQATAEGAATGARIRVVQDPVEGVRGADVVYTDVWASMGRESEAEARRNAFRPYQVNGSLFAHAKPDAAFLHCLPAHRGEEVAAEVIDGPRSVVFQQAENRLHVQKAILLRLMGTS